MSVNIGPVQVVSSEQVSFSLSLRHAKDFDEIYFVAFYGNQKERKGADMSIYLFVLNK